MKNGIRFKRLGILRIFAAVMVLLQCVTAVYSYADVVKENGEAETLSRSNPPKVIAHGGGAVDGISLTNSLEAVRASIEKGCRLIELDMLLTADNEIVMIHDFGSGWTSRYLGVTFDEKPTKDEFLSLKIMDKYTTMSFDMLTEILDEYPDVMIVTDCKEINYRLLSKIATKYPDYIDRIIPQIYYYHQYNETHRLGFENIILTLYSMDRMEYHELAEFIDDNDIFAVTVGVGYKHEYIAYKLARRDITVYMHPVNDYEQALTLMDKRIHGVYSSTLSPSDFETAEARKRINAPLILKEEIYAACI